MPQPVVLDTYSSLGHKPGMDSGRVASWLAPQWADVDARRLTAYRILKAYERNRAREFLDTADEDVRAERREYGDARLLIEVAKSALLGDDVSIVVEGAGDGKELPADATPEQGRAHAAEEQANRRQEWIDEWAVDERLRARVDECERNAVTLGDGVYVLGWSPAKGRVTLETYDPGFYFPHLDPRASTSQYPQRVDLVWEFELDGDRPGQKVPWVHRITWELRPIPEAIRYPWNDSPSNVACFMTEGDWLVADLKGVTNPRWTTPATEYRRNDDGTERRDLQLPIDFIPVVHVPNSNAGAEHFGESILLSVAQLLDELASGDTDSAKAAALACVPMIGLSGETAGASTLAVKAGAVFNLGLSGRMDVVDLSASLTAAMAYVRSLRGLLSENARVPEEVLGRVKGTDVRAGIIMALAFGPLRSLVEEMRLVRDEKYPLLLKMQQRITWASDPTFAGPVMRATVNFGSFLPTDSAAVIDSVVKLWTARLISRETAIRRLVEDGVIDADVADELRDCRSEDFAAALGLLNATDGDLDAVYEFLSRPKPERPPTPPAPPPGFPQPPQPVPAPPGANPKIDLGGN